MKDEDKVITHEWLVSKDACYFDQYSGEPDTALGGWLMPKLPISIEQLGRMRKIPARDKLWALYRLMSEEQCSLAARRSALRCIGNWDAPEIVLRWLRDGLEEDRAAAAQYEDRSPTQSPARTAWWSAYWSACGSYSSTDPDYEENAEVSARHAAQSAARAARSRIAADFTDRSFPRIVAEVSAENAAWSAAYSSAESAAVKDAIAILQGSITEAMM